MVPRRMIIVINTFYSYIIVLCLSLISRLVQRYCEYFSSVALTHVNQLPLQRLQVTAVVDCDSLV